jgi:potassium/chloride transporter 4/5/6
LGNVLGTGAPRLIAKIAEDATIPILRRFKKPEDSLEPKAAVWLTFFIASACCLPGNLTPLTPIITMFFLQMYATINLSCFIMSWVNAPSFRPTFRYYHGSVAGFGVLWCVGLMLAISWYTALGVFGIQLVIVVYIYCNGNEHDWGDLTRGIKFELARKSLLLLNTRVSAHAKNWRPQLLVLVKVNDEGHPMKKQLLTLASQLKLGEGLTMVHGLIQGDPGDPLSGPVALTKAAKCRLTLRDHLVKQELHGFARVNICEIINNGIFSVIQGVGVGALHANTIMVGWPENWRDRPGNAKSFVSLIRGISYIKKAIVVLKVHIHVVLCFAIV